ncbi:MAG: hypothetical protein FJ304_00210 [Planctomycetes bacterium]|nr:hypothetical protein [Planctomycetota bacterium]
MPRGTSDGKPTQKAMVQAALDEKGWKVKTKELQSFIRDTFGVELKTTHISNYKSNIKKEKRKAGRAVPAGAKPGRKPGRKPGAVFADLEAVRAMVGRLGADQVKKLVDVAGMFD